ncbi:MAG: murein biosynthesis integral membrane protein MurJ [Anaerolineae bacterium]|nr:murein biosynthesis integral membrane protein MurJ [Anaerolineae bacterium]MDW8173807.1 murein biosynthesis integral membrane protein MurJ [Anaerolineae bacterium]
MTAPLASAEVVQAIAPPPPDLQAAQEATNAQVAGASGLLALGNVASRVLGLLRETALTYFFGATAAVDAFLVATIVPKALYDLLIGGHINGAIVPVLSEVASTKGRLELWRVLSALASLVLVALTGLVLLLQVFAYPVVQVAGGGADPTTLSLASELLRLTSLALIFLGLFAVFSGALIALKRFSLTAFAGAIFNGCIALATVAFAPPLMPLLNDDPLRPVVLGRDSGAIAVVALGWVMGAAVQMGLMLLGLRGARLRFSLDWRHPALRHIALLYAPVMFSLVMDTLIIRPFSYNLASRTGSGSIAYMNWATTLIQFPQGLVATAISVAILPTLAGLAALRDSDAVRGFRDTLGLGLRLTTILIIPSTLGLAVMAHPIIVLLFQHGAFTAADTIVTTQALHLYLIGLPFAALDLLLVYAFYARKDTLTPALIGVFSLGVYMVCALALLERHGLFSLMIADSVKHIVHAVLSAAWLHRRMGGFGPQRLWLTLTKTLIATGCMAVLGTLILPPLTAWLGTDVLWREAALVLICGGACVTTFFLVAYGLRLEELHWLMGLLRRRLLRG